MEPIKRQGNILFILVLYKCTVEESKTFQTLLADLPDEHFNLFVYDNSPYQQSTSIPVGHYIHDISNGGIGKAYNSACEYAQKNHYQWMMLLDQDTEFPHGAIETYNKAIIDYPHIQMIVPRHQIDTGEYISPTHYRFKTSRPQKDTLTGLVRFSQASPINSGILLTVSSFIKAGGYDDAVWLDFSDIRFIEKYKKQFDSFYVIKDIVCRQNFSATEKDPERTIKRHQIYLECAANYPRDTISDSIAITYTTFRKSLSQTYRIRGLKFLIDYWNIYIMRKQHEE